VLNGGSGSTYSSNYQRAYNGSFSWAISSNISVGNYILTISGAGNVHQQHIPRTVMGAPGTQPKVSTWLIRLTVLFNISSLNPTSGPVGSTQVTVTGTGFTLPAIPSSLMFIVLLMYRPRITERLLTFSVPSTLYYNICQSGKMCPNLVRITTNGSYNVSVTNANGDQ